MSTSLMQMMTLKMKNKKYPKWMTMMKLLMIWTTSIYFKKSLIAISTGKLITWLISKRDNYKLQMARVKEEVPTVLE